MYRSIDKPTASPSRNTAFPTESARDEGRSALSPNLAGWALWLYVGLILATLAALIVPPVVHWLAPLVKP